MKFKLKILLLLLTVAAYGMNNGPHIKGLSSTFECSVSDINDAVLQKSSEYKDENIKCLSDLKSGNVESLNSCLISAYGSIELGRESLNAEIEKTQGFVNLSVASIFIAKKFRDKGQYSTRTQCSSVVSAYNMMVVDISNRVVEKNIPFRVESSGPSILIMYDNTRWEQCIDDISSIINYSGKAMWVDQDNSSKLKDITKAKEIQDRVLAECKFVDLSGVKSHKPSVDEFYSSLSK